MTSTAGHVRSAAADRLVGPDVGEGQLDLTYLASGFRQHVFVATGVDDGAWVYKIPAAYGTVLPYRHRVGKTRPASPFKRMLNTVVMRAPVAAHDRAAGWLSAHDSLPPARWAAAALTTISRFAGSARDAVLSRYFKHRRRRNFATMLGLLERLSRAGLDEVLLPYRISRDGRATLRIDGRTREYAGPILAQQRAEVMEGCARLTRVDWARVVDIQHRLWRQGVSLTERGEVLGTRSWAWSGGQVYLADTSSLTNDRALARRALSPASLDDRQRDITARLAATAPDYPASDFFSFVRAHINRDRLEQLWGVGDGDPVDHAPPNGAMGPQPPVAEQAASGAPRKHAAARRTVTGMLWVAWGKGANAILQLVVLGTLARLLSPADFGVVSAALVVISVSAIFSQLGMGPSLVQRPQLERRHLETAFASSAAFGILLGTIVWSLAPVLAAFFRIPEVTPVLRALAWVFPLRGLAVVAESLLERELRFRPIANLDIVSYAIGYGVVGITLALRGAGVWALVAANGAQVLVRTTLLLRLQPPPRLRVERNAFRELFYFGGGFTLARLGNLLAHQGDNIVVGRLLGPAALGLYGRAYQLMSMPATLFGQVLDTVLFPTMARVQNDERRLGSAYLRGIALIALVMLPVSALLFVLAPEVIRFVLGPQWDAVILPFRIFSLGMLFRTSYKMSDSLARATGAVYRRAWRQAIHALLVIAGAAIGSRWGIPGVAAGVLVAVTSNFLIMAQLSVRVAHVSWTSVIAAHRAATLLALGGALAAWGVAAISRTAGLPSLVTLIAGGAAGAAALAALAMLAPRTFVGADGLWMLEILRTYLPARARRASGPAVVTGPGAPINTLGHHADAAEAAR